jgi:REP element-mobilizing transposase RayT
MDRFWFFTWRTYGTWLPGAGGFVGQYVTPDGRRVSDNTPGTPNTEPIPALERYARSILRKEPVLLTASHAEVLLPQLIAHATFRGWALDAVAIMVNHIHVVFGVPGDPDPDDMLDDWKAYASRPLNRLVGWDGRSIPKPGPARQARNNEQQRGGRRTRPLWWERDGSTRALKTPASRVGAICYVRDQVNPLAVWLSDDARKLLAELEGRSEPNLDLPGEGVAKRRWRPARGVTRGRRRCWRRVYSLARLHPLAGARGSPRQSLLSRCIRGRCGRTGRRSCGTLRAGPGRSARSIPRSSS